MPLEPTREHAVKILSLLSHGLVRGKGEPIPGKMCVEAAVCYAMGLPHNDNPPCVGAEVRSFKIGLNDMPWENNLTRAKGMRRLAIAQLGSNKLNQSEFKKQIEELERIRSIIPSFDWIPLDKRIPEHNELKKFVENETNLEKLRKKFSSYNHNYNYSYYNHYYCYYHNYNYSCYYHTQNLPFVLQISADIGVEVLQNMNCKGCAWLDLVID